MDYKFMHMSKLHVNDISAALIVMRKAEGFATPTLLTRIFHNMNQQRMTAYPTLVNAWKILNQLSKDNPDIVLQNKMLEEVLVLVQKVCGRESFIVPRLLLMLHSSYFLMS